MIEYKAVAYRLLIVSVSCCGVDGTDTKTLGTHLGNLINQI